MIKVKKGVCNNCKSETIQGILLKNNGFCEHCFKSGLKEFHESTKEEHRVLENIEVKDGDILPVITKLESFYKDIKFSLPIYSASYLNKKLHKDYNSIKSEKICIAVPGGYILHEDIIKQFKESI